MTHIAWRLNRTVIIEGEPTKKTRSFIACFLFQGLGGILFEKESYILHVKSRITKGSYSTTSRSNSYYRERTHSKKNSIFYSVILILGDNMRLTWTADTKTMWIWPGAQPATAVILNWIVDHERMALSELPTHTCRMVRLNYCSTLHNYKI